jgi:uncharacterized protein
MKLQNNQFILSASDLMNFAGCRHNTGLDRQVALGVLKAPSWVDPNQKLLQEKGQAHEQAYINHLREKGLSVFECGEKSVDQTVSAMQEGYDIITQAYLQKEQWVGYADVLRKIEGESRFGHYLYEVMDTKLASETKGTTLLQLCLYNEILHSLQEASAEYMYVVKPGDPFAIESFRFDEFKYYFHSLKRRFEAVMTEEPQETYPMPVAKCSVCRWWKDCENRRESDDHVSLIAGAGGLQIRELETNNFRTLESYASSPVPIANPSRGSIETYKKLYGQAKVQLDGRSKGEVIYEMLPIPEGKGLNNLPKPSKGDIFFDIEGDRYFEGTGIEYLFGYAYRDYDQGGKMVYEGLWVKNREEEKQQFEKFMDFCMKRWERYPDFHIYHYAPYEPSSIKQLAGRYATKESERDRLLRGKRLVDLLSITRQSIQASVTGYSLKDVEKLTGYTRKAELRDASAARRRMSTAFQVGAVPELPKEDFELIEEYNKDDCHATYHLYEFLQNLHDKKRTELGLERPVVVDGDESDEASEIQAENQELFQRLIYGVPTVKEERSPEEQSKWLLAHMIEYYRREENSQWWDYFSLQSLEGAEEIYNERKAILGLEQIRREQEGNRLPVDIYSFPFQEIEEQKKGTEVEDFNGNKVGKVEFVRSRSREIGIKKTRQTVNNHPRDIFFKSIIPNKGLESSLKEFISNVAQGNIDPCKAGYDLLMKRPPDLKGGLTLYELRQKHHRHIDLCYEVLKNLNKGCLPIQGPPGTGKTYLGGSVIASLMASGKRVGISAVSHKVIDNLLHKADEKGEGSFGIKHVVSNATEIGEDDDRSIKNNQVIQSLDEGCLVGATVFSWSREEFIDQLDYLFVDEAGQMSLANVLAASRCAKNIILLGDPQQLEQPQRAAHPEGSDISALNHILDGHQTMPEDKGLFLDITYRLNPEILQFNSSQYYEGRLHHAEGTEKQCIVGPTKYKGSGYFVELMQHEGNQNKSVEEVEKVFEIIQEILTKNASYIDREGKQLRMAQDAILVIAPYNAQVLAIQEKLAGSYPEIRVGTVDKFQGQEAPVVIYSMSTSSAEEAPRGMGFLYDPHRLNVATSRAQGIAIIVASEKLFDAECHTVEQMKMANGLCALKAMANVFYN